MHSPYQNSPNSSRPVVSFRPQTHTFPSVKAFPPATASTTMSNYPMRHGILQGESICTENLTPWTKTLPCRVQAGLGRLLSRAPPLLDVHYSSVALHFKPVVPGSRYQLTATLTLVAPMDPLPAGSSGESRRFSLAKMFPSNTDGVSACPLASSSKIIIHENNATHSIDLNQAAVAARVQQSSGSARVVLDLKKVPSDGKKAQVTIKFTQTDPAKRLKNVEWLDVRRWMAGWGLQRGQLAILISNKLNSTIDGTFHQVIPWLMRLYFHTIRFTRDGQLLSAEQGSSSSTPHPPPLTLLMFLTQFYFL